MDSLLTIVITIAVVKYSLLEQVLIELRTRALNSIVLANKTGQEIGQFFTVTSH